MFQGQSFGQFLGTSFLERAGISWRAAAAYAMHRLPTQSAEQQDLIKPSFLPFWKEDTKYLIKLFFAILKNFFHQMDWSKKLDLFNFFDTSLHYPEQRYYPDWSALRPLQFLKDTERFFLAWHGTWQSWLWRLLLFFSSQRTQLLKCKGNAGGGLQQSCRMKWSWETQLCVVGDNWVSRSEKSCHLPFVVTLVDCCVWLPDFRSAWHPQQIPHPIVCNHSWFHCQENSFQVFKTCQFWLKYIC